MIVNRRLYKSIGHKIRTSVALWILNRLSSLELVSRMIEWISPPTHTKILLESLINWKVETIQDKPSHSYKLQRGTLALTVAASSKAQPIRSPQFKSKILHYKTQTKPDVQFKQTAATSIISIDKQTQMMNAIII